MFSTMFSLFLLSFQESFIQFPEISAVIDQVLTIVSIILTIVSIILSFVLYYKPRRNPVYISRTTRLFDNRVSAIDNLEVLYDKKRLSSLSITKIVFWNRGRDTIRGKEIAQMDKLRIVSSQENDSSGVFEILTCVFPDDTNKANNFRVQIAEDKKTVLLDFDYMNFNDGIVIKLIHTGVSSVSLKGSIQAVKTIKSIANRMHQDNDSVVLTPKGFNVFSSVVGCVSLLFCIMLFVINEIVFGVAELVCGLLCVCIFLNSIKQIVPSSLSKDFFSDEI